MTVLTPSTAKYRVPTTAWRVGIQRTFIWWSCVHSFATVATNPLLCLRRQYLGLVAVFTVPCSTSAFEVGGWVWGIRTSISYHFWLRFMAWWLSACSFLRTHFVCIDVAYKTVLGVRASGCCRWTRVRLLSVSSLQDSKRVSWDSFFATCYYLPAHLNLLRNAVLWESNPSLLFEIRVVTVIITKE